MNQLSINHLFIFNHLLSSLARMADAAKRLSNGYRVKRPGLPRTKMVLDIK